MTARVHVATTSSVSGVQQATETGCVVVDVHAHFRGDFWGRETLIANMAGCIYTRGDMRVTPAVLWNSLCNFCKMKRSPVTPGVSLDRSPVGM